MSVAVDILTIQPPEASSHKRQRSFLSDGLLQAHSLDNAELAKFYEAAGFRGRVGWGERPAILVIDMAGAWTNPDEQIGSDLSEVEDNIVKILAEGRRAGLPIIFTTMAWDPSHSEIGEVVKRKTTHSLKMLHGTDRVALRPQMERRPHEPLVVKPRASAFYGTNVDGMLISAKPTRSSSWAAARAVASAEPRRARSTAASTSSFPRRPSATGRSRRTRRTCSTSTLGTATSSRSRRCSSACAGCHRRSTHNDRHRRDATAPRPGAQEVLRPSRGPA